MVSSDWKDYEDRYKPQLNERKIEFRKHAPKKLGPKGQKNNPDFQ
jgi:hypothetical protein